MRKTGSHSKCELQTFALKTKNNMSCFCEVNKCNLCSIFTKTKFDPHYSKKNVSLRGTTPLT